jgi:hypothetical protein
MAEKLEEIHSRSCECSPTPSTQMGTPLRKVLDRVSGFATPWKRGGIAPRGRRIFHRDVEREEFQHSSTHCLSSYYSVFVARLAIMVCEILTNTNACYYQYSCYIYWWVIILVVKIIWG